MASLIPDSAHQIARRDVASNLKPYLDSFHISLPLTWTFMSFSTLLLATCFISWLSISRRAGWALIWLTCSWVAGITGQIMTMLWVHDYSKVDSQLTAGTSISHRTYHFGAAWYSLSQNFIILGVGLEKAAVAAYLLVVLGRTHQKQRWALDFVGASNVRRSELTSLYIRTRNLLLEVNRNC